LIGCWKDKGPKRGEAATKIATEDGGSRIANRTEEKFGTEPQIRARRKKYLTAKNAKDTKEVGAGLKPADFVAFAIFVVRLSFGKCCIHD
jgi:hypothetical protein